MMRVTAGGASDNCMDTYTYHRTLAGEIINHVGLASMSRISVHEPQKISSRIPECPGETRKSVVKYQVVCRTCRQATYSD